MAASGMFVSELWDDFVMVCWRWTLWLCRSLWPIHVHHQWSELDASIVVHVPWASAPGDVNLRLFQITDSHLSEGPLDAFEHFHAARMHGAFRSAASIWNGTSISPVSAFRDLLDLAKETRSDVVLLTGDVVNFPQRRSIEWVARTLNSSLQLDTCGEAVDCSASSPSRIPFIYTTGNHDWFYEGSAGTQWELRREWRQRELRPLYNHAQSLTHGPSASDNGDAFDVSVVEVDGVLLLSIDNSLQQITPAQLSFFRSQMLRWKPTVLLLHVPLSVHPRLRPFKGFALCGDPSWGASTDRSWRDERRQPWPKSNSRATSVFLEAVLAAAAPLGPLIAVVAGHVHAHDVTPFAAGVPVADGMSSWGAVQYIGHPAFKGGFRLLDLHLVASHGGPTVPKLEETLHARRASSELLGGLARVLSGGLGFAPACWRGAPSEGVGILDVRWLTAAIDAMLQRTEASMREGLVGLSRALRPALDHWRVEHCGWEANRRLAIALNQFADPALLYLPGQALELGGVAVLGEVSAVVGALKREEWDEVGEALGHTLGALSSAADTQKHFLPSRP